MKLSKVSNSRNECEINVLYQLDFLQCFSFITKHVIKTAKNQFFNKKKIF